jgi:hypothetical protein
MRKETETIVFPSADGKRALTYYNKNNATYSLGNYK